MFLSYLLWDLEHQGGPMGKRNMKNDVQMYTEATLDEDAKQRETLWIVDHQYKTEFWNQLACVEFDWHFAQHMTGRCCLGCGRHCGHWRRKAQRRRLVASVSTWSGCAQLQAWVAQKMVCSRNGTEWSPDMTSLSFVCFSPLWLKSLDWEMRYVYQLTKPNTNAVGSPLTTVRSWGQW